MKQAVRMMSPLFAAYCCFAGHVAAQISDLKGDSIRAAPSNGLTCWLDGMDAPAISNVRGAIAGTGVVLSSPGAGHTDSRDERVAQTDLGDADVCIRTRGVVVFSHDLSFIDSISYGGFVVMASRSGGRTMELTLAQTGLDRTIGWRVDGSERQFGLDAANWEDAITPILASYLGLGSPPEPAPRVDDPDSRMLGIGVLERLNLRRQQRLDSLELEATAATSEPDRPHIDAAIQLLKKQMGQTTASMSLLARPRELIREDPALEKLMKAIRDIP